MDSIAQRSARDSQIFIIGCGISGIGAAQKLIKHGFNKVRVIEATARSGGRIRTGRLGMYIVFFNMNHNLSVIILMIFNFYMLIFIVKLSSSIGWLAYALIVVTGLHENGLNVMYSGADNQPFCNNLVCMNQVIL